ncbi:MarR family transcriptional regulator [Pseudonocardia sp. EV170527-09]|uniref:MarR family winged helix-turn-helix transcriptional regulator n=1 Tax=Pseudonocardia sp. EV170527-09 TaxID=2603411 RepID=UPI0011F3D923|nr:MarR family transcriptional regulator [Pseudonocardia sp. EV170527-09]KAA1027043.1 MarR family transcriptional regulator [Pseudonocardia sp. EV170527-09]
MNESRHLLEGLAGPTVALEAVARATHEFTGRQARRAGLHPTDLWALRLLDVHGSLGPTELARRLDLRPASTTALIDRLEAAGHLERVPDPHDRRRVTVRSREESFRARLAQWEPAVRALDDVARRLSDDEGAVVERYLREVVATLDELGAG